MEKTEEQSFNLKDEGNTEHVSDGHINNRLLTPNRRDFKRKLKFLCQQNPIEEHVR